MPYDREQRAALQRERRRRMKAAGYSYGWVKHPPKYGSVVGRISVKPTGKRKHKWKKPRRKKQ